MNDKDRDLIEQVLRAAGEAGEHGFGYLVHYTAVSGATNLLANVCIIALVAWLFKKLLAWKPKEDFDQAEKHIGRVIGMVILSVVALICISDAADCISALVAPEGAAIHSALK
jgi:hypothetical protein